MKKNKKSATLGYRIGTCLMINTLNASALIFGLWFMGVEADRQDELKREQMRDNAVQVQVLDRKKGNRF